jgi:hypothetical protein
LGLKGNEVPEPNCVAADGVRFPAKYPVLHVRRSGDKVFVIYDYMAFPREFSARNLFAYNLQGVELWRADDIGMGATDAYVGFEPGEPLIAYNFAGYACRIDEESGRVLSTDFTK